MSNKASFAAFQWNSYSLVGSTLFILQIPQFHMLSFWHLEGEARQYFSFPYFIYYIYLFIYEFFFETKMENDGLKSYQEHTDD